VPWWPLLDAVEAERVADDMQVAEAAVGEFLCRIGRPATLWFGVVEGLLKMSNDSAHGAPMTFTGVPSGAWFGAMTNPDRTTPDGTRAEVQALEADIGRQLDIDHRFYAYNEAIPTADESWDVASGRIPMVSWGASDTMALPDTTLDNDLTESITNPSLDGTARRPLARRTPAHPPAAAASHRPALAEPLHAPDQQHQGREDAVVQDHAADQPGPGGHEVLPAAVVQQPRAVPTRGDAGGTDQAADHVITSSRLTHLVCSTPGRFGAMIRHG